MTYSKYIIIFLLFLVHRNFAQVKEWNLVVDKQIEDFYGFFTFENDSFYYVLGRAYDHFPTYEQGINISKIQKSDGLVIQSNYFDEDSMMLEFYTLNKIHIEDNNAIFPMFDLNKYKMSIYNINLETLNVKNLNNIILPPNYTEVFINDYIAIGQYLYIVIGLYDQVNTDRYILKVDKESYETKFIKLDDKNIRSPICLLPFNDGFITAFAIAGDQIITGKIKLIYFSSEDEKLWEYESPTTVSNWACANLFPLNEREILFVSTDPLLNYSRLDVENRFSVMRFNTETKKIVWHTWWNEPRKFGIYFKGKIVKGFRENEYLLMANDGVKQDTFNYTTGKIVKFNDKGQRLWQKTYYHSNKWAVNNSFNDIIKTRDSTYLIAGAELRARSAWLVKIDEDGNLLPIDTTSAAVDFSANSDISEIKVYPNPASHSIIINQGDITDMHYQLIDMQGAVIKSLPIPYAHHNVIWDISDMDAGNYVLTMLQSGKVIGSKKVSLIH